jgi:tetrapyrrole methylase family protein/MazG family protein
VTGDSAPTGRPTVVVVGLGPAGADWLPPVAVSHMRRARRCFLRTRRHPAVPAVEAALADAGRPAPTSFDEVYDTAATFDEVYATIAETLVRAAVGDPEGARGDGADAGLGPVCLAVPGSPLVGERVVELLRERPEVTVVVVPAPSFLDVAWERLGVDPLRAGVQVVDAADLATMGPPGRGPLLVGQCHHQALLSEVKLAVDDWLDRAGLAAPPAVLLHHLGLPDEQVLTVPWADIDRTIEPDHLTSLWVPALPSVASGAARLEELVRTLRQRCPWDRRQTHGSLAPHLLEETYEALDAITDLEAVLDVEDAALDAAVEHLAEELGDVAFQVFFHAHLAAERGWFTVDDVLRQVHDKLVARHPHVFGDAEAHTAEDVASRWEELKQVEKGRRSAFDGVPMALPALTLAAKVQRKAAALGVPSDLLVDALPDAVAALLAPAAAVPSPGWRAGGGGAAGADEGAGGAAGAAGHGGAGGDGGGGRDGRADASGPASAEALVGAVLAGVVAAAQRLGVDPELALRSVTIDLRRRAELAEQSAVAGQEALAEQAAPAEQVAPAEQSEPAEQVAPTATPVDSDVAEETEAAAPPGAAGASPTAGSSSA